MVAAGEACIEALAGKLGSQPYFFGDKPTCLDAVAYGYLAIIWAAPFQSSSLRLQLDKHDNLKAWLERVTAKVYGDVQRTYQRRWVCGGGK